MEQTYIPEHLPEGTVKILQQQYADEMATIEGALTELEYLKSSLQNYKGALANRITKSVQYSDILAKYSKPGEGVPYGLPGVNSDINGGYDMEQLEKDKTMLLTVKQENDEATRQSDMYYRMITSNNAGLTSKLQKIGRMYTILMDYISQLQTYSKGNYK